MDYYYALLESYEQLKRRKFKLSLREADGDPSYDEDEARKVIKDNGTALDAKTAKSVNGVKIWKTEKKVGEVVTVSYSGAGSAFTATLMTGEDLNPNNKPGADKLIAQILGQGNASSDTQDSRSSTGANAGKPVYGSEGERKRSGVE